jgi:hypothetical protein
MGSNHTGAIIADRNCPVKVMDSGFSPGASSVPQGATVAWAVPSSEPQSHAIVDLTGMGLFDSGPRAPGASFVFTYIGAGDYSVIDTVTGMSEAIQVPILAVPSSGDVGTTFTITWSSATPSSGCAFDVQVMRPGLADWESWLSLQATASSAFVADAGTGT